MELSNWVEQRGSVDVAKNMRGAIGTISMNEVLIKKALSLLMTPTDQFCPRKRFFCSRRPAGVLILNLSLVSDHTEISHRLWKPSEELRSDFTF
ncbi:hypothetical protein T3A99_20860 [Pseudomonas sp. N-137]|uniref:hypothetical protein n=1 Tax=Pseudomonas sp. N-137 TaxID=3108452 RepID=UPI002ADEF676|nr:hypothetical protein [Pseudomonas sp. N-137]MEA1031020.1 hypothetical protein [Pseudomonas sp. N-137]